MKLTQMGTQFSTLTWPERVAFIESYRTRRSLDIAVASDFNLAKQAKSTKARTPKVAGEKKVRAKSDKVKVSPAQLSLLRQLGLAV